MTPAVVVPAVTGIPSAIEPGIVPAIIPWIIPSAVPASVIPRIIIPGIVPSAVPAIVVERTVIPRVIPSVPSAVVPGIHAPVDGGIERTVPGIPRGCVPRLVGSPGVPSVVIEIDGSRVLVLVEIYLGYLVIGNEQGVDFLTALHEDR